MGSFFFEFCGEGKRGLNVTGVTPGVLHIQRDETDLRGERIY